MASGSQMLGVLWSLQGRGTKRRSWSASFPQLRPWEQRWMSWQAWGGFLGRGLLDWTEVHRLCVMCSSTPSHMALTLGTAECNSGCRGNFSVGTSPFTKKRYCHIAQRLRHIGGGFRRAKRGRGTCKLPQDWWANLSPPFCHTTGHLLPRTRQGWSTGEDLGSRLGTKQWGRSKLQLQCRILRLAYQVPFHVESARQLYLWAAWSQG